MKIIDNTIAQAFHVICDVGEVHRLAVCCGSPPDRELPGCLAGIGRNSCDADMAAGRLAVRLLKGELPATMASEPLRKTDQQVSEVMAKAIGGSLPPAVRSRADRVVA